jgi:hypothetical protein
MVVVVFGGDELVEWRCKWDVEAAFERHEPVNERPGARALARYEVLLEGDQRRVSVVSLAKMIDEVEGRIRYGEKHQLHCVAPGQSVGHRVGAARFVLHCEV